MRLLKSLVGAAVVFSVANAIVPGSLTYAGHRRALSRRCNATPHNLNGTTTPPAMPMNGTGTPPDVDTTDVPTPEAPTTNGTANPPDVDTPTPTTPMPTESPSPSPDASPLPVDPVAEPAPPADGPSTNGTGNPPAVDTPPTTTTPMPVDPVAEPAPSPADPSPSPENPGPSAPPSDAPAPPPTTPNVPGSPLTPPGQPTCSCQICHPGVPVLPSGYDPKVDPVEKQFDQLNKINIDADVSVGNLVHVNLVVKIVEEGLNTCEARAHDLSTSAKPDESVIDLLAQVIVLTGPTKDYCEKHVPALIDVNGSIDIILGLYLDLFVSLKNILQVVLTINVNDDHEDDLALLIAELDLDLSVIINVLLNINILGIQIHAKVDASVKVVLDLLIKLGLDSNESKLRQAFEDSKSGPGLPSLGKGLPTDKLMGNGGPAGGLGKSVGGLLKRMEIGY